jgi:exodeoxyribonuclease-5
MELTAQQNAAMQAAMRWWQDGDERPFLIQGYAGTGKSTTVGTIAKELTCTLPAYMAFTNKAARVLASKINSSLYCGTIHGSIYFVSYNESEEGKLEIYNELCAAIEKETDKERLHELLTEKRRMIDEREIWTDWSLQPGFAWDREWKSGVPVYPYQHGKLIIVDECSMVRTDIGQDLMGVARNAGYRVLAVGDPGQLPPVAGKDYFGPRDDISYFTPERCACAPMLTDVMRQSSGSSILTAATAARNGATRLPLETSPTLSVYRNGSCVIDPRLFDQIICGRHLTRRAINTQTRKLLGRNSQFPETGDKMMFQTNNRNDGYYNGDIFIISDVTEVKKHTFMLEGTLEHNGKKVVTELKTIDWDDEKGPLSYAYAITCHKSQGSEYGNVLLYNESFCFKQDAQKWLYTGITRAKNAITVIQ